ncbi:AI-2E family transporter [Streptomyces sp. NBC_01294]|uniref:AI-2E family transporter n=1 Tax=Streptomyces sp. NBC_01294 TaxID=2903815 RepID=UPI002DDBB818|nr:AI-2E family transporter [Streptomyces sp. NBC_01294]WRZ55400.1 AI-2E family transporter [Streptomyces sp. NBC_01294]WRZ61296.1 AI-2E family transporter [Streptomyces sp. NBC_01294]
MPPVSPFLRTAAAYAWRLLVVGAAVYAIFAVLGRFHEIAVAVFLGLVVAALLWAPTRRLERAMPRTPAVALCLFGSALLLLGVLTLVGEAVAGESTTLTREFRQGLASIEDWLERPPFRLNPHALSDIQARAGQYLSSHRSTLLSQAVSGAGRLVHVLTVLALAVFCSVCFLHGGDRQWTWFRAQLPGPVRERVAIAGSAAWRTFTGYTHGILLVAATNAVLVGVALYLLGVPLAVPLALLEFFAAFIPLIGSPVALAIAAVVALAAKGPLVAALVVALIVVIGQIEGHVLHPLVMSRAVRLHPLVVAISVVAGAIAAGVVGAVVAVPLVSVVWSVHSALRRARLPAQSPDER